MQRPRPQHAGYIFGCAGVHERECRSKRLFGLPAWHRHDVLSVQPHAPLFLFNYEHRVLYGVFSAEAKGGSIVDSTAWNGAFPSQIRVRGISPNVRRGEVLQESEFRGVLPQSFFAGNRLFYPLNAAQVAKLRELFSQAGRHPAQKRNLTALQRPPKRQGWPLKGRKRILRLSPDMAPLGKQGQGRSGYFTIYWGMRVVVDDRHPITHFRPPERPWQRRVIRRQPSEDRMDFEATPWTPPTVIEEPPFQTPAFTSAPLSPRVASVEMEPQKILFRIEQEAQRPVVPERHWNLGSVVWNGIMEFRRFIAGETDLPPVSPKAHKKRPLVAKRRSPKDAEVEPESISKSKVGVSTGGVSEGWDALQGDDQRPKTTEGHIKNQELAVSSKVGDLGSPTPQESADVVPVQEDASPSPVELPEELRAQISKIFQDAGYEIVPMESPSEFRVPGSTRTHLCFDLRPRESLSI